MSTIWDDLSDMMYQHDTQIRPSITMSKATFNALPEDVKAELLRANETTRHTYDGTQEDWGDVDDRKRST